MTTLSAYWTSRAARRWRMVSALVLCSIPLSGAHAAEGDAGRTARYLAFELAARTEPAGVADQLQHLLIQPFQNPQEQLALLRLQGQLEALLERPDRVQAVLGQLAVVGMGARTPAIRADARAAGNCLRADLLRRTGSLRQALRLEDAVMEDLATGQSAMLRMSCLATFAAVSEGLGNAQHATQLYQQAQQLVDAWPGYWQQATLRSSLAYTLLRAGQLDLARERNDEAKALATQQQDWLTLGDVATVQSMLLTGQRQDKAELEALTSALDYARKAGARREVALYLANLSDFYLARDDFARALAIAREALPLAEREGYATAQRLAAFNASLALIATHHKHEGLRLSQPEFSRLKAADDIATLSDYLKDLGRYLEVGGYDAEALQAYREQRALASEKFRREQQRTILEMQEGFDAERRRHEKQLLTDDNQLQAEALRQSDLQWRQWALATAVGLLSLGLLYKAYRKVRLTQQQLHQNNERLREQSELDPLTRLANRHHFHRLTHGPDASPHAKGSLFLLDLDHFKQINDRFGHAAGDAVLVEVGRRLRAAVRSPDPVLRWGGEEFLIMAASPGPEHADALAERLLEALNAEPVQFGALQIAISASIGHAEFPLQPHVLEVPWDLAVDLVDAAMYIAKTQGRNRAFGVRELSAADLQSLQGLVPELERAWRDGRVTLAELARRGPAEAVA